MTKTFAVCVVGTCIALAACSGSEKKQASDSEDAGNAGQSAEGGSSGGPSAGGSSSGGKAGSGGNGGKPSGSAGTVNHGGEAMVGGASNSAGGVTGNGGDSATNGGATGNEGGVASSDGGATGADGGAASSEGGATQGGASGCEVGEAQSPAAPGSLDLFGQIAYFGSGAVLPAGHYRVSYVDGCMKYASAQDWAIHAYGDGSIAWWLGTTSGNKLVLLPGTVGIFQGQGGYTDFEACVAANSLLAPIEFDFAGGVLGVWLADDNYGDNVAGLNGRNPVWKLTLLDGTCQ